MLSRQLQRLRLITIKKPEDLKECTWEEVGRADLIIVDCKVLASDSCLKGFAQVAGMEYVKADWDATSEAAQRKLEGQVASAKRAGVSSLVSLDQTPIAIQLLICTLILNRPLIVLPPLA